MRAAVAAAERLALLRASFRTAGRSGIQAFVVPSGDAHNSEYVAECDKRREFISGFSGSAGTAVVTERDALLWTDGRYYAQATQQLSSSWRLMKDRLRETPTIGAWLSSNLPPSSRVGVDPFTMTVDGAKRLRAELEPAGISLEPITPNLVDLVWGAARPARPADPVFVLELRFAGQPAREKIANARAAMAAAGCGALVVSALDEVMWLLNLRGHDTHEVPVAFSYAVVTDDETLLFIDDAKVPADVRAYLEGEGVALRPYDTIVEAVRAIAERLESAAAAAPSIDAATSASSPASSSSRKVWVDSDTCSLAIFEAIAPSSRAHIAASPLQLPKAIKNETEIAGFRAAHVRDAVALVRFFAWLERELAEREAGRGAHAVRDDGEMGAASSSPTSSASSSASSSPATLTEHTIAEVLHGFRARAVETFRGLSFDTIAGSGPNGAIIHYHAQPATAAAVTSRKLLLLDSGAQYLDGTTDVTRTLHFGEPTAHQRRCYTRVLQGHIALSRAVFPKGTPGTMLDSFARAALWRDGLDYRHGTGHGVGHFLAVHEGPDGVANRARAYTGGLVPGMTMTDEPGYYEEGEDGFGIRIENILLVKEAATPFKFGGTTFCEFEPLTVVPIATNLVDADLLDATERAWLNAYNARVRETLAPLLAGPEDVDALRYLERETRAL